MRMTNALTPRLADALKLTFELFGGDSRKSSPVPVMAHLLGVCQIVQQDGGSEDEAIAALLHDVLEDKPGEFTEEQIRERFGDEVRKMVLAATDTPPGWTGGPKPPWRERKQAYLDGLRVMRPDLLRPTIADKIDNVRSIIAEHQRIGEEVWSRFGATKWDQFWYYQACYRAYQRAGVTGDLLRELGRQVDRLARCMGDGFPPQRNAFVALAELAAQGDWCMEVPCTSCGNGLIMDGFREIARGRHPDAPDWIVGNERGREDDRRVESATGDPLTLSREEQARLSEIVAEADYGEVSAVMSWPPYFFLYPLVLLRCEENEAATRRLSRGLMPQFERLVEPEYWRRTFGERVDGDPAYGRTLTVKMLDSEIAGLIKRTQQERSRKMSGGEGG